MHSGEDKLIFDPVILNVAVALGIGLLIGVELRSSPSAWRTVLRVIPGLIVVALAAWVGALAIGIDAIFGTVG